MKTANEVETMETKSKMKCAFHSTNAAVVRCNCCARPLCPACDHRIRGFPFCQECIVKGVELLQQRQERLHAAPSVSRRSSPLVALLLSLLVPGLGAAYNGQTSKALVHFGIFAGFFQIAVISNGGLFFVLGVLATLLFAAVDAYRTAQVIRSGLTPQAELDLIARRLYGNPLAWGVVLLSLGTIFLLHTLLGIQLPMRPLLGAGIVMLGAYMLYDFVRTRRRRAAGTFDARQRPPSVVDAAGNNLMSGNNSSGNSFFDTPTARYETGELATRVAARPVDAETIVRPFERLR